MVIIFYIIFLLIYCVVPAPLQGVVLLLNGFIPDPIPVIDEIIMVIAFCRKLTMALNVYTFISKHKFLTALIVIAVISAVAILLF